MRLVTNIGFPLCHQFKHSNTEEWPSTISAPDLVDFWNREARLKGNCLCKYSWVLSKARLLHSQSTREMEVQHVMENVTCTCPLPRRNKKGISFFSLQCKMERNFSTQQHYWWGHHCGKHTSCCPELHLPAAARSQNSLLLVGHLLTVKSIYWTAFYQASLASKKDDLPLLHHPKSLLGWRLVCFWVNQRIVTAGKGL